MDFTVLNWNIGGAKYLQEEQTERKKTRKQLNNTLQDLMKKHKPHVVTLQEIVRYGTSKEDAKDIIDPPPTYRYYSFPLIDSDRLSSKAKWNKVKRLGHWHSNTFFAQGNAILLRNDVPHFPVWDLSASSERGLGKQRHFIEQVNLETGLYFGNRNTEPRAALVAHFMYNYKAGTGKPLDIFVINLHLTTLMMEREGIPEIDLEASRIRLYQLNVVIRGIVSQYNKWKRQGYPERDKPRRKKRWETFDRYEPVWILAGDFNFTPESLEYETMKRMNFIDVVPQKGSGTKAKGAGKPATLVVDYIFAGPKFISLDPLIAEAGIKNNKVDHDVEGSDHYPMFAKIPLAIPEEE
jgi:endonuclease/exonuclease/phosphatase family metal-dependent hydrolase